MCPFFRILWAYKSLGMQVQIKREKPRDIEEMNLLFKIAFEQDTMSQLVKEFRTTNQFIPELSRLAHINDQVIGSILCSRAEITKGRRNISSIIMVSLAVLPSYQNLGIGIQLVHNSLTKATELGYQSVLVLGPQSYFGRFGFKKASEYGIFNGLPYPEEDFLALELTANALKNASGKLKSDQLMQKFLAFHM